MTINAPAKINVHLAIKNKRTDGFHNLESIFLAIDLSDTLNFQEIPGENSLEIGMKSDDFGLERIPVEKNIIFKAVSLYRNAGFSRGLRITVEKRIPPGGGLGGGSSDAASTMLAMDELLKTEGTGIQSPDISLKKSLGSDITFFLHKSAAAWVGGTGEIIEPIAAPENIFFVLVNPGFQSETVGAYQRLDELRSVGKMVAATKDALIKALYEKPEKWPYFNDFLPVFDDGKEGKIYRQILSELKNLGAGFANLSGSGSTCYGVFSDREFAEKAYRVLKKNWKFVKFSISLAI